MRILLAPMEGVVDHHMRHLLTALGGVDGCVTEFVRISQGVLPASVYFKLCPELLNSGTTQTDPPLGAQCPIKIQLLGCDPALLARNAAMAASLGATAIDINFGCPAKTVNKNRGGACLLEEPELLHAIVAAVRQALPEHIPVSAKIRLGFHGREGYLESAQAIAEAGAAELVVHARSKEDGYRPPAYWECIGDIRRALAIPVVANGEIWCVEDYFRCRELSGCADVMLGRGLLSRPDLALAIKTALAGQDYRSLPWSTVAGLAQRYFEMTGHAYQKKYMGNRLKQWLFYLQREYPQARALFDAVKREHDYARIHQRIEQAKRWDTPVNTRD